MRGLTIKSCSVATLLVVVGGCGGDGSDSNVGSGSGRAQLSGAVVKGPVAGARVCAYELSGAAKGRQLACTTSGADGGYELSLDYRGPVIVEATGGTYTDEATGTPAVALAASLTTMGDIADGATTLFATPLTTLAMKEAARFGGLSVQSFEAGANEVRRAFGLAPEVDLARTRPDVTSGTGNSYGRALVAFSRMLQAGASLPDLVATGDLPALKAAAEVCSSNLSAEVSLSITVFEPFPAWRATLPNGGPLNLTGCDLLVNTPDRVLMSCDPVVNRESVTVLTGTAVSGGSYAATPLSSALTLAGARVVISGTHPVLPADRIVIEGDGSFSIGDPCSLAASGRLTAPISSSPGGISLGSGQIVLAGGAQTISGSPISISGGGLALPVPSSPNLQVTGGTVTLNPGTLVLTTTGTNGSSAGVVNSPPGVTLTQ